MDKLILVSFVPFISVIFGWHANAHFYLCISDTIRYSCAYIFGHEHPEWRNNRNGNYIGCKSQMPMVDSIHHTHFPIVKWIDGKCHDTQHQFMLSSLRNVWNEKKKKTYTYPVKLGLLNAVLASSSHPLLSLYLSLSHSHSLFRFVNWIL